MSAKRLSMDEVEEFRRIRTLVVDNSPFWLQSVCNLLQTDEIIQMVGTARDGGEALDQIAVLRPDLVLMNFQMPDMTGLEATAQARRMFPFMRVVLLTGCDRPGASLLSACAHNGVNGLVTKSRMREELLTEIQQVFAESRRN